MKQRLLVVAIVSWLTCTSAACNVSHDDTVLLQEGEQAMREGRLDQAVELLERAAIANRKNVVCWRTLAEAYAEQGNAADLAKVNAILASLDR